MEIFLLNGVMPSVKSPMLFFTVRAGYAARQHPSHWWKNKIEHIPHHSQLHKSGGKEEKQSSRSRDGADGKTKRTPKKGAFLHPLTYSHFSHSILSFSVCFSSNGLCCYIHSVVSGFPPFSMFIYLFIFFCCFILLCFDLLCRWVTLECMQPGMQCGPLDSPRIWWWRQ